MSNPPPVGNYRPIPLRYRVAKKVHSLWTRMSLKEKLMTLILIPFAVGILFTAFTTPAEPLPPPTMPPFDQLVIAMLQTMGALFKIMITNAGAWAKELIEPMLWIAAFVWVYVLGIGAPVQVSRWLRDRFGR